MMCCKNKFIFIHINKTGGSSIEKAFEEYGIKKVPVYNDTFQHSQHFTYKDYKKYLGNDFKKYYKFTVIRNPWDRAVSYYHNGAITDGLDFSDWVNDRYNNKNFKDYLRMYQPCSEWIETNKIDFILRFENLEKDFEILMNNLKLNLILPKINITKNRNPYQYYYNEDTKNIISNYFKKDIINFNYKF